MDIIDIITSPEITTLQAIYKLVLSMLLGCLVGYQRKRKGQNAGIRTFSLIAMGAALAMILSIYVPQEYLGLKNGDPGRIAAQVVSGVGFLGAGAIIQMKGSVRGLTTAAGIWMVAAIGLTVGAGLYTISIVATLLILFILVQLEKIENRIHIGKDTRILRLKVSTIIEDVNPYRAVLDKYQISMINYYVDYDYEGNVTRLNLVVLMPDPIDTISLFGELRVVYPTDAISLATQVNI